MKMYFDYYGNNFRDYKIDEIAPDYIQFVSEGKEYIIDLAGDLDFGCDSTNITGRFKGDTINIEPIEEMTQDEIKKAIFSMDKSTFKFGLFEEGDEPNYEKLDITILIGDDELEFSLTK
jgi:hypothetical protein